MIDICYRRGQWQSKKAERLQSSLIWNKLSCGFYNIILQKALRPLSISLCSCVFYNTLCNDFNACLNRNAINMNTLIDSQNDNFGNAFVVRNFKFAYEDCVFCCYYNYTYYHFHQWSRTIIPINLGGTRNPVLKYKQE